MNLLAESLDKIGAVAMLLACAIIIRQTIIFSGQNWIRTFSHSITLILLPIITFSITSVISGNIALSLGMVGALSIVRFRNPVKSPFELIVYFLMISLGIAAAVSFVWMVLLMGTSTAILIASELLNRSSRKFLGKQLYTTSFTEGNSLHIAEISASEAIAGLLERDDVVSFNRDSENFTYRLASYDKNKILEYVNALQEDRRVQNVSFIAG